MIGSWRCPARAALWRRHRTRSLKDRGSQDWWTEVAALHRKSMQPRDGTNYLWDWDRANFYSNEQHALLACRQPLPSYSGPGEVEWCGRPSSCCLTCVSHARCSSRSCWHEPSARNCCETVLRAARERACYPGRTPQGWCFLVGTCHYQSTLTNAWPLNDQTSW